MRIGELAGRAGTSARTLRYYEQHGLLTARRTANGYRDYDEVDLRLVREIRSLLEIGFNLEETRPFVECLRSGRESGAECPASLAVLGRKLADIDTCIARLLLVRGRVNRELAEASGRGGATTGRAAGPDAATVAATAPVAATDTVTGRPGDRAVPPSAITTIEYGERDRS